MEKAVYIHGLDGSGNGSSAKNIKKILDGIYNVVANTYDHLDPVNAFEQIKKDTEDADIIIASSLGAFYASCLFTDTVKLLINPCWNPCEAIPEIAYKDQKERMEKGNCIEEWENLMKSRNTFDSEVRGSSFAVFSDNDELFSFVDEYASDFLTHFNDTDNMARIHGTHEAAKDMESLGEAFNCFWTYLKRVTNGRAKIMESSHLNESRFLNMWFNSDEKNEELIQNNLEEIWEIIDKSYAYLTDNVRGKGGPGGLKSPLELYKDCAKSNALVKCYKSGGKIQAVAIYNLNRGGRKLSLIGCDCDWNEDVGKYVPTPLGKVAIKTIMKEDIDMVGRNFWGEVSDNAENSYYFGTKAASINPEIVKALMPEKHFQPASKHKPVITLRNKKTGEITGHEENRFNKDYYDRELFKDSGYHTKVAITNPENVDKVKDFEKETFGKKRKTSK